MDALVNRRRFLTINAIAASLAPLPSTSGVCAERFSPDDLHQSGEIIVHTETPLNSEPVLEQLVKSWITPVDRFYVRSHAPTPKLDADSFQLSIEGLVHKPFRISLRELQEKFPMQTVTATMTCAGNRRSEHGRVKPVGGVPWGAGAIGNAQWGGAALADLLNKAGLKENARHVWFEGVDRIDRKDGVIGFGGSIPLTKAIGGPAGKSSASKSSASKSSASKSSASKSSASQSSTGHAALVVYEMNDRPLTPDHGFPLRAVVPGYIGARSVKWLGKIVVSDRPSPNHYLAGAYKLVTEGTAQKWSAAKPIYSYPINSVTCSPAAGAKLRAGLLQVKGYALAPGESGRTIARVEISTDVGKTWKAARFTDAARPYCWRLWQAELKLTPGNRTLLVRCVDSTGLVQPQSVDWNLKGYLFNGWHATPVKVQG